MHRAIIPLLLMPIGVLAVISDQLDDSPGLGGIGLILIATALWMLVRGRRNFFR